tara:strand:+ start:1377 stop:1901 length:525 start_codon:yes stop_codon:yes gene_type:complete
MNITDSLIDYFNKTWRDFLYNAPSDGDLAADLSEFLGHIKDMKLHVNPITPQEFLGVTKRLVVNGWEYVGPGDINLDVYFDVDHYSDLPIDHYLVAQKVLIPWIQNSFLKYFGLNIFTDFADIVISFYDKHMDYDEYDISVGETNTQLFYNNPPKYWKEENSKPLKLEEIWNTH